VEELRDYTVEFPTGSKHHHTLRAVGEGDVANKNSRAGDLLFRLNVQPHPLFELIEGTTDLVTKMEMDVEKLRTSFDMQIERLGGEREGYLSFNVPSYPTMQQGETRTVRLTDFTDYGDLVLEMKARESMWSFTS
jgi:DnaJ-class molecular chaperone